jgi:transposase-like protein
MNPEAFERLVTALEGLTAEQRTQVAERLRTLEERADSERLIVERLGTPAACPHCTSPEVMRFGHISGQQRFRCKGCTRTFMALTGTPLLRLRDKNKLLAHAACMSEGRTIRDTARALGLSVDRAFRWRHRFLEFLARQTPSAMTGVVEADDTSFPRSFKGQRQRLPRPAKKRGGPGPKGAEGDGEGEPVPVVVAMQRGTRCTHDAVLTGLDAPSLTEALRPALGPDAVLSTDGHASYGMVARTLGIEAGSFVASYHGPGGSGTWHVQNVNAYHARLKGWMARFHGVATKYLDHYLGWRRLLDRYRDAVTGEQFLFHALRPQYINI